MGPYLILALATGMLGYFLCERHPSKRNDIVFLSIISVVLIAMSAVRGSTVGIDYKPYLEYFKQVCDGGWSFLFSAANVYRIEIGYSLLNYVISLVTQSQLGFALGIALVCIVLTAVFLYKHSPSVWVSMFVFITFGFFGYTLVTIRHQIAICIFMFALPYLQNKKFVPYLLIVLLTATFHKSMLLLIPLFFIAQIPLNWKSLTVYSAGTLFLLIFSEPILSFITQYIYKSYQVGTYYMRGRDFNTAFIPIILFGVVMLLKKRLLQHDAKNLPLINLCCYCCLLFILTLKHFVFQRFALILLPVAMLLLPEIMSCMKIDEDKAMKLELTRQAAKKTAGDEKKRALQKYGELKVQLRDQQAMYNATIGFILFGSFVYYLFLLNANRLLLVPYVTML